MTNRSYILTGVTKHYVDQTVLSNVDASFSIAGLTAIIGPSGSGKSTLLRLLAMLEGCSKGELTLESEKGRFQFAGDLSPWPFLTCVFQKQFLWPHMTLRENILLPMVNASLDACNDRLDEIVANFQMSDFINRYPNQVSGGQAQRAALARALGVTPSILLLDEIHTGLDFENRAIVNRRLRALIADGVSLIVVTHSLDFVERFASRVILVEGSSVTVYPDNERLSNIPYISAFRGLE